MLARLIPFKIHARRVIHISIQAMLYATDGINTDEDFNKAMIGVASVWCDALFRSLQLNMTHILLSGMRETRKSHPSCPIVYSIFLDATSIF